MKKRHDVKRYPGLGVLSFAFFVYLYAPLAIVILYSFNENRITGVWTKFSLKWYGSALNNAALVDALKTSLLVAVIATVVATTIALMAAMAIIRGKRMRARKLSETVVNLPLLLPEIVLAVATLILFSLIGLQNGLLKLVIAHSAFCTPFAFLPIRARLQGMSLDFEEAASDLYARRWTVFRRVTLPLIFPGLFSGAMLAFLISMDDFITSNMLSSGGTTTLPVYIFSLIRAGTSPELNAVASLLILASLILATVALTMSARGTGKDI
ncbi:ABC transporter permease [Paracoccus seriniphilus]|uniref:Spermidine/putrescine transport system permease protein PotC n=1 Tax=Paracoccus seriniphilus TaxID=184748 RepID=A0A239PUN3_9RHOB|nr:ABC transporter permease [Paracoccus seriniphilus]WCR15516.1 ABC transporter permease [Paracoccus seriniphilus]SNT74014.1 spermidine/putrescine transport system permease protein [Paracoccus seriniphilus]